MKNLVSALFVCCALALAQSHPAVAIHNAKIVTVSGSVIAKGTVVPIWTPDAEPTFASELTSKGALVFQLVPPASDELEKAVDDLGSALEKRIAAAQVAKPAERAD